LELFRQKPCDLVLTDLDMPAMDGVTLARHIKFESPRVPVVLMTGNVLLEKEVLQDAGKAFINDVLHKPFEFTDLHTAFQRLL
jgi:two-component system, response regulator YesN